MRLHRNIFGADVESLMLVLYTESSQICRLLKTKRKSTKGQTLTDKALHRIILITGISFLKGPHCQYLGLSQCM